MDNYRAAKVPLDNPEDVMLNEHSRTTMASDTRHRIVAAAARLFHEHGYHATGVAAILGEAEVNSGSLYHFFDTKAALLEGVVEHHLQRLGPMIFDPAQAAHHDPVERIFIVLEHYRRTLLASEFGRGCPVGRLALEIGDGEPEVRALVDRYFTAWTARVEHWLEETAGSRLSAGVDRVALARLVLAVTQGGIMLALAAGSIEPYDAAIGQLRRSLERPAPPPATRTGERAMVPGTDEPRVPDQKPTESSGWRSW
jgi:AcrR family transcriptional regulator